MTILALTARSESGKDFLAKYNIANHNFVRVSFSDQLKKMANKIYPWCDVDYVPEQKNLTIFHPDNTKQLSPRDVWKSLDVLRQTNPTIFVDGAIAEAKELIANGTNVIFTDVRKEVEVEAVRNLGATLIKITSPVMTDYTDENIIDEFEVDHVFKNVKGNGYLDWIKFLHQTGIIETQWSAILTEMVEIQHNVNDTFSPKWNTVIEDRIPADWQWRAAISDEHGELMAELAGAWVWWKPATINNDKALEELVDVFSFSLGYVMSYLDTPMDVKEVVSHVGFMIDGNEHSFIGTNDVEKLVNLHAKLSTKIELDLGAEWADDYDTSGYMINLCKYASIGCKILGATTNEFFEMYKAKHELNLARSKAGYQTTGDKTGLETVGNWKVVLNTKSKDTSGLRIGCAPSLACF